MEEGTCTLTKAQFVKLAVPLIVLAGGILLGVVLASPTFWAENREAPRLFAYGAGLSLMFWVWCLIRTLRFTPRGPRGN